MELDVIHVRIVEPLPLFLREQLTEFRITKGNSLEETNVNLCVVFVKE